MNYTYILKNKINNKLYIGSTNNLKRRIAEHRKKAPFVLVYYEAFFSEKDARNREKQLKYFGRAYQELKKRIKNSLEGAG
ncbi:GIY-YIG nuclease family protein [bacterium]|nr:GIY-YIG nuclease family protein [bacterium]